MSDLVENDWRATLDGYCTTIDKRPLTEVSTLLKNIKDLGTAQDDVREYLERKLAQTDIAESEDDRIRDVLDLVTGFCSPYLRVW